MKHLKKLFLVLAALAAFAVNASAQQSSDQATVTLTVAQWLNVEFNPGTITINHSGEPGASASGSDTFHVSANVNWKVTITGNTLQDGTPAGSTWQTQLLDAGNNVVNEVTGGPGVFSPAGSVKVTVTSDANTPMGPVNNFNAGTVTITISAN
ncbi:MAG: hypothetical protein D6724_00490 [Armatimonadetes bacterium]|nr:MAG: hypothetical protein D6724_00490 [Armatimonadota bacterium]